MSYPVIFGYRCNSQVIRRHTHTNTITKKLTLFSKLLSSRSQSGVTSQTESDANSVIPTSHHGSVLTYKCRLPEDVEITLCACFFSLFLTRLVSESPEKTPECDALRLRIRNANMKRSDATAVKARDSCRLVHMQISGSIKVSLKRFGMFWWLLRKYLSLISVM